MSNEIFLNARAKALESKLITKQKLIQFINSSNLEGLIKLLSENTKIEIKNSLEYEKLLTKKTEILFDFVKNSSIEEDIKKFFLLEQDYQNISILIKSKLVNQNNFDKLSNFGLIGKESLIFAFENLNFDAFTPNLKNIILDILNSNYLGSQIDTILKKSYYNDLLNLKNTKLLEIINTKIDLINLESCFRCLNYEKFLNVKLDGGILEDKIFKDISSNNLSSLKNYKKDYLQTQIKQLVYDFENNIPYVMNEKYISDLPLLTLLKTKYNTEDINPLLIYILYSINEIKNLRITFVGILNNLDKEKLIKRLRVMYEG